MSNTNKALEALNESLEDAYQKIDNLKEELFRVKDKLENLDLSRFKGDYVLVEVGGYKGGEILNIESFFDLRNLILYGVIEDKTPEEYGGLDGLIEILRAEYTGGESSIYQVMKFEKGYVQHFPIIQHLTRNEEYYKELFKKYADDNIDELDEDY